jgi:hypothetical protein
MAGSGCTVVDDRPGEFGGAYRTVVLRSGDAGESGQVNAH